MITIFCLPESRCVKNGSSLVAAKLCRSQFFFFCLQKCSTQEATEKVNTGTHGSNRLFAQNKVVHATFDRFGAAVIGKQPNAAGEEQCIIFIQYNIV